MNTFIAEQKYQNTSVTNQNFIVCNKNEKNYHLSEIDNRTGQNAGTLLSVSLKKDLHDNIVKTIEKSFMCIVPLSGNVRCITSDNIVFDIKKGHIFAGVAVKHSETLIQPLLPNVKPGYLIVSLKCDASLFSEPSVMPFNADSLSIVNKLISVFTCGTLSIVYSYRKISIGNFEHGRSIYYRPVQKNISKCLLYVLKGKFRVEGAELSEGDSFSVWNTAEILAESLSDNALILIIEYNGLADSKLIIRQK